MAIERSRTRPGVRRLERAAFKRPVGGCKSATFYRRSQRLEDRHQRPEDVRGLFRNPPDHRAPVSPRPHPLWRRQGHRGRDVPAKPGDGGARRRIRRGVRRFAHHPKRQRLRRRARRRDPARLHDERALFTTSTAKSSTGAAWPFRTFAGTIHTIGDPTVRFRDPIRLLRAVSPPPASTWASHPTSMTRWWPRGKTWQRQRGLASSKILRLLRGGAAHRLDVASLGDRPRSVVSTGAASSRRRRRGDRGRARRAVLRQDGAIDADDASARALARRRRALDAAAQRVARRSLRRRARRFARPTFSIRSRHRGLPTADGVRRIVAILPRLTAGRAGLHQLDGSRGRASSARRSREPGARDRSGKQKLRAADGVAGDRIPSMAGRIHRDVRGHRARLT